MMLRLSASLLLIVEKRHFTLILPGKLLEKLKPCRKMLHKGVLDLVALAMLTNLEKSFLKRRNRTRYLRLMLLLLHSMLFRVWATRDRLGSLVWIRDRWKYAIWTANHHHCRRCCLIRLGLRLVLSYGLTMRIDRIFSQQVVKIVRLLAAWAENVRAGTWCTSRWRSCWTLNVFHGLLGRSQQILIVNKLLLCRE